MVPRRTWYNHDKLSLEGKVHHSVATSSTRHDSSSFRGIASREIHAHAHAPIAHAHAPSTHDEAHAPSAPISHEALSLSDAILTQIVELQVLLDRSHVSIENQGKIMQSLFGASKKQPFVTEYGLIDHKDLSLGRLLTLAGPEWNGDLHGVQAPTSWKQMTNIFKGLGMVETEKWRLCTGDNDASHAPVLMKPHEEDCIDLKLGCLCTPKSQFKHRRDCSGCSQKCPKCEKMRKDVLSFEYMPIVGILTQMCLSRTLCYENLALWRSKQTWRGLPVNFTPASIKEFWDGSKFKEYAPFWDPKMEWELPIICANPMCKHSFRAFPESQKCEELSTGWDSNQGLYIFTCPSCFALIEAPKRKEQVSFQTLSLTLSFMFFLLSIFASYLVQYILLISIYRFLYFVYFSCRVIHVILHYLAIGMAFKVLGLDNVLVGRLKLKF